MCISGFGLQNSSSYGLYRWILVPLSELFWRIADYTFNCQNAVNDSLFLCYYVFLPMLLGEKPCSVIVGMNVSQPNAQLCGTGMQNISSHKEIK